MSEGKRKLKVKVTPPRPICKTCPWRIWCSELNFRTMNPQGEEVKVCPIWWMVIGRLREKGILKDRPRVPPPMPISSEEARAIMDAARRKRRQGMGIAS